MNEDVRALLSVRNSLQDIERDFDSDYDKALKAAVLSVELAWSIAERAADEFSLRPNA